MGKPLTNAPRGTYRNLAQFETAGNFPADGQTPQPLLKGDGTESPLAFTATKAFAPATVLVNGLTTLTITVSKPQAFWLPCGTCCISTALPRPAR
jgi:hypothetical protein